MTGKQWGIEKNIDEAECIQNNHDSRIGFPHLKIVLIKKIKFFLTARFQSKEIHDLSFYRVLHCILLSKKPCRLAKPQKEPKKGICNWLPHKGPIALRH